MPHGYFIVVETNDDGDEVYAVYQGDYDYWRLVAESQAVKFGEYDDLKDAKDSV